MAKITEPTIAERIEEANEQFGIEIEITGGGKGWKGEFVDETGVTHSAAADSKGKVLSLLINEATDLGLDSDDEPGEEIEGCSDECQSSTSNICQCACNGDNHGIAGGVTKGIVVVGEKPCKCGCGLTTKRTFVPGHDARYHGLVALRQWAVDNGQTGTDEDLRKAKAASLRKAARERRAAKRAEIESKVAAVVATIPTAPKGKSASKKGTKGPKALSDLLNLGAVAAGTHDDLPF